MTLHEELQRQGQAVVYIRLLTLGDHRLRVTIKSDSYAEQCWGKVERWDGNAWQTIHHIGHAANLLTPPKLAYRAEKVTPPCFALDDARLIAVARLVLEPSAPADILRTLAQPPDEALVQK